MIRKMLKEKLVTVFSINKTYRHLKASFCDMIQCVYYIVQNWGLRFMAIETKYSENLGANEASNKDNRWKS